MSSVPDRDEALLSADAADARGERALATEWRRLAELIEAGAHLRAELTLHRRLLPKQAGHLSTWPIGTPPPPPRKP
jgi:hypothetical protein